MFLQERYFYSYKTGEFFGRSLSSWAKLLLYSVCFAAGLAVIWGLFLWVFYQTLDNYTPRLQTSSSFIGSNPGLGYRPMRQEKDPYSSLIWFKCVLPFLMSLLMLLLYGKRTTATVLTSLSLLGTAEPVTGTN